MTRRLYGGGSGPDCVGTRMKWLLNLFRPFEPPTDKQVRFAQALGINVTPRMSKQGISEAIDAKKAGDPTSFGKVSEIMHAASRRAGYILNGTEGESLSEADEAWLKSPETRELVKTYKHWVRITSHEEVYGLVAYRNHATRTVDVDVATVSDAGLDHDAFGNVRVVVSAAIPSVERDSQTGWKVIEFGKSLGWYPVDDFLLWERLPKSMGDIFGCIVDQHADASHRRTYKRYRDAIAKGFALAKQKRLRYS